MNQDYTDEREPLDTKSMLESGFFARLGKDLKSLPAKKETREETPKPQNNYNTENILLNLFDARDGLIETYSKAGIGDYSQNFVDSINKIGACIRSLGGEANNFDPLAHVSGLQSPNIHKNAKRVIENTVESYSLGKIDDAKISENGKEITMTFTGRQGNTDYKAVGTLVANKSWVGNEAIDYIYSTAEGRMSVKVFSDDGKWIDKSDSYKISWELFENEVDMNVMPTEGNNSSVKKEGNSDNPIEIKEEVKNNTVNNIEDEEIGDFPIEEKK